MRRLLLALVAISLSWPLLAQVTAIDQLGREVSVPQPVEREKNQRLSYRSYMVQEF